MATKVVRTDICLNCQNWQEKGNLEQVPLGDPECHDKNFQKKGICTLLPTWYQTWETHFCSSFVKRK